MSNTTSVTPLEPVDEPLTALASAVERRSPQATPGPSDHGWGPPVFVWGVWALMLLGTLAFVRHYGSNMPVWDEWCYVPQLTGIEPVTAASLWEQHNEHRIPLPKVLFIGLFRLTHDFRAAMGLNVLLLGFLAAALMVAVRRVRSRFHYSDAFFPVALLNWGHFENLLVGFQLQFVSSTFLAGMFLILVARRQEAFTVRCAVLAGLCLLLLPLCGGNGLILVPFGACWLGIAAFLLWRSPRRPPLGQWLLILGLVVGTLLLIPLYFLHLEKVAAHPPSPGLRSALRASVQFWGISVGPASAPLWKISGPLVAALLGLTALLLLIAWWQRPQERLRALGLLAVTAAMAALALAVGWGRSGLGDEAALTPRYTTLGVLTLCCIYLGWTLYSPRVIAGLVEMCLFAAALSLLAPNMQLGVQYASDRQERTAAFEKDIRAREPLYRLTRRYAPALFHPSFTTFMPLMKQAGIGAFSDLQEDPPFQEISVALESAVPHQVTWTEGTAQGGGKDSWLLFTLPQPRYVAGIRLTYTHANDAGLPPVLNLFWKNRDQGDFPPEPNFSDRYLGTGPEPQTATIWVDETIDQFRLHPDEIGYQFHILELCLLAPFYVPGSQIDCTRSASQVFLGRGWHGPEAEFQWCGPEAAVTLPLEQVQPLRLRLMATSFGEQRCIVRLNGHVVGILACDGGPLRLRELDLPTELLGATNTLAFELPEAHSPRSVGESEDSRVLGLAVAWIELVPPPGP